MVRLLIADDERTMRETISTVIDWQSLNVEIVATCKDGLEAYAACMDLCPDIVLTDIRMPGLSGLDLIQKLRKASPDTRFIILSGYGEFQYAQEAMSFGVQHYLLKPCNEEQIIRAVKETAKSLSTRTDPSGPEQRLICALREQMLQILFLSVATQAFEQDLSAYGQYFDLDHAPYMVFETDAAAKAEILLCAKHMREAHASIANAVPCCTVYIDDTLLFFFEKYDDALQKLTAALQTALPRRLTRTWETESLEALIEALRARIQTARRAGCLSHNQDTVIQRHAIFPRQLEQLTAEGGLEAIRTLLDSIQDTDVLAQTASHLLIWQVKQGSCEPLEAARMLERFGEASSQARLRELIDEICLRPKSESPQDLAGKVQRYVLENISDSNISLKWIAENHLYMNVNYVSRCFVRDTGMRFSTFLTRARVERAKQMLKLEGYHGAQTIAQAVGCGNNPQYFCQIFKKETGQSIQAFARSL